MIIDDLLRMMLDKKASDLHLKAGRNPILRIHGELIPQTDLPELSNDDIRGLVGQMVTDEHKVRFDRDRELDLAYTLQGSARFRVNVLMQREKIGSVIRVIPWKIPTLEEMKFPPILADLALKPRGLVLVTGPTGSGKSTTLAAMLNHINVNEACHILTVEDPIEFVHQDKKSVFNQRELGTDTLSFSASLKHALRQDPDVILVGEMRDPETIQLAITAAETGHMVFSTLHTTGAAQTIDRVIDVFSPEQQPQIRTQLAGLLEGVVSQTLLAKSDGSGRACAMEIMICTPAIRNLIREGKIYQIPSTMQTGVSMGMQTLDSALKALYEKRIVSFEEAASKATNPEAFRAAVEKGK
ncbi:MAG: type IV pilus twitching motility protein PilT [Elusimicrobiota bacterium]